MKKIQKVLPGRKPVIFVDKRERSSNITRHLKEFDLEIREKQLEVGDYILSDRVCCERKTIQDFLQSITNQRIFRQLESLASSYEKPILILEGNQDTLFTERNMHANTIRGVLASVAIDYGIPIIWTQNSMETAAQLNWIAKREQELEKREIQIRSNKKNSCLSEQQEFLISGLPHVSNTLSRRLLERFKTPKRVFTARAEQLLKIDKIGEKKAEKIRRILDSEYEQK